MMKNMYFFLFLTLIMKAQDNTSGIGNVAGTQLIKNTDQQDQNENPVKNITQITIPENRKFRGPLTKKSG